MDPRIERGRILGVSLPANVLGGLLTYAYFRFVDSSADKLWGKVTWGEILFFVLGFGLLSATFILSSRRWARPLEIDGGAFLSEASRAEVRRRAMVLPYVLTGLNFLAWAMAGFIWGGLWPLLHGSFSLTHLMRRLFGVTLVAGTVTTAFIFFVAEHQWRHVLPVVFPTGDLSAVPGVRKLRVRARLLVIFLMLSIVPLSILGVLASTGATALLGAEPAAAADIVQNMLVVIVFIVAIGIAAAVGLSILFSDLRDVTPWVEATSPREVVSDLNAYFTAMEGAIRRHRGLVLQFIGDEIEAVLGAPVAYARSTPSWRCARGSRCGSGSRSGTQRAVVPARRPCGTASASPRGASSRGTSAARSGLPTRSSATP